MRGTSRLAALVVAALTVAGCWPHAGFDAGRSNMNAAETELNRATVGRLEVLWTRQVQPEGLQVTGLVAVGDGVYASAARGRVARLDAATGDRVWSTVVDAGQTTDPPDAFAPVYFQDRLRVSWGCCRSGVAGVFWLDPADGQVADAPPGGNGAGVSDPAIAQGRLAGMTVAPPFFRYVTWGDMRVGVSDDGIPAGGEGPFAIGGDRIYWAHNGQALAFGDQCRAGVPSPDPRLYCAPDWRTDLGRASSPIVVGTDAVMWATPAGPTVLDADTGAVRWRAVTDRPTGTPVVADSTIVLSTGDWLVAFAADGCGAPTCEPLWRAPVGGITGLAGGGDLVFATTARGEIAAYGVEGCRAPSCPPLALVDVGDASTGTPIVHGGRLVVSDATGRVTALGLPD